MWFKRTLTVFICFFVVAVSLIFISDYVFFKSKQDKGQTAIENKCANLTHSLICQSFNSFGDYSKLNDAYKKRISEENFERLCFRDVKEDDKGNSLHCSEYGEIGVDGYEKFYWTYPKAKQKDDYVVVGFDYDYYFATMNEFIPISEYNCNTNKIDPMMFVKVNIKDRKNIFIEKVFDSPKNIDECLPEWAENIDFN